MTWHVWQVDELLLGLFELSKFVWYRGMKKTGPCSYLVYPINPNLLFVQCSKLCSSNNFIFFLIPSICTYDQTISFVWGWSQLIIFALPKHFSTKKIGKCWNMKMLLLNPVIDRNGKRKKKKKLNISTRQIKRIKSMMIKKIILVKNDLSSTLTFLTHQAQNLKCQLLGVFLYNLITG